MKKNKIIIVCLLLVFFAIPSLADLSDVLINPVEMPKDSMPMHEINIKIGFDFDGSYDAHASIAGVETDSFNTGNNVSFAAEYIKYINQYIGVGGGISAQIPRWLDELPGRFGFAPAYISFKVRSWPYEPGMYAYVVGQIGYNLFYSDSDFDETFISKEGGFYYGIGLGIVYDLFLFEGMYSVNSSKVEDNANNEISIDYGKFTLSVGCKL